MDEVKVLVSRIVVFGDILMDKVGKKGNVFSNMWFGFKGWENCCNMWVWGIFFMIEFFKSLYRWFNVLDDVKVVMNNVFIFYGS